ncbi:hypothetical protein NL108_006214 [Boleophthalmus pectinirostris]|uniref:interferon gamma receptor 1-like n=1 Tax=Boleophthalmus pectinirostris TaxID=150288 RepID=UPI00242EE9A2|nr:interferon gamma receptor 1-like [Boleophthalmus pectinirostris]KAJ0066969.1 hypothetical protein NL108_006214 [Boleophthalmus pectinirostris]
MDSAIPTFLILFCFWIHVVGAKLPSPTNVTLDCHNMQNTLQWTYDQLSDGITFTVTVRSINSEPESLSTSATSIDLSKYSDPDRDYAVWVSAVNGSEKSEEVPEDGIEYSYYKDAVSPMICKVDFPFVSVTREDKHLHLSFTHPAVLYSPGHKSKKKKSLDSQMRLPIFHYDIHIINQTESHKHSCSESVCQDKLPVHDSEKIYCLIMSGEMKKISVQATEKYCSKPLKAAGISALAYILPIVLVVVGGLLIVLMVFVKKTKSMPLLPSSLNISKSNGHRPEQKSHESEYSSAHLDPSSPTLLIHTKPGHSRLQ